MERDPVIYDLDGIRFIWHGGETINLYRRVGSEERGLFQLLDHHLTMDPVDDMVFDTQDLAELVDEWIATGKLDGVELRLASAQMMAQRPSNEDHEGRPSTADPRWS